MPRGRKPNAVKAAENKKYTPTGEVYFSLDIGTRTVVGIVGEKREDDFHVIDCVSIPHNKRAMTDGQIEDIEEVSKVASKVIADLEKNLGIKLENVAIAAAGRALRTKHVKVDIDIEGRDVITEDMVRSFEMEAVQHAQTELDNENPEGSVNFYCVGHSIINFYLDDYPLKNFVGHRGKTVTVDMIAAFLPETVVESLYAVTDKLGLEVKSLTLEPIAAMNVIIPPEVRLINIALVDIGAGTSDIAISKGGSIVAYAMATTAGDEITEEIIRNYLVDFNTAEQMKLSATKEEFTYTDILGLEHTISSEEFFKSLYPAVDLLATTIAENIVAANGGEKPAAVFLVGGGSRVEGLAAKLSEKLGIPEERVAIGNSKVIRHITTEKPYVLKGPEFITPVGIGVTATMSGGYDFSTIILNGKKIRAFNKNGMSMLDILSMAGYRSTSLLGRSGRNLTYTIDGNQKLVKGGMSDPAVITVNGLPANINSLVNKGDKVDIVPAKNGEDAAILLSEAVEGFNPLSVKLSGMDYKAGVFAVVNEKEIYDGNYRVENFDNIRTVKILTIGELLTKLDADPENFVVFKGKRILPVEYLIADGDEYTIEERDTLPANIVSEEAIPEPVAEAETPKVEEVIPEPAPIVEEVYEEDFTEDEIDKILSEVKEETKVEAPVKPVQNEEEPPSLLTDKKGVTVILNGKTLSMNLQKNCTENIFLELMAYADIDTQNPQGDDIDMTRNGKPATYMDVLKDGDVCSIKWITRRKK